MAVAPIRILSVLVIFITGFLFGCGKDSTSGSISVTASFLNGTTGVPSVSLLGTQPKSFPVVSALSTPSNGFWYLSPDRVTITITSIGFTSTTTGSSNTAVSCDVVFDKSQPSLAKIKDCPFTISAGTYKGLQMQFNNNIKLYISDSDNGIFTDTSATNLLSMTAPPGGAQEVTFDQSAGAPGGTSTFSMDFEQPLEVKEGEAPTIYVVFDPTQWLQVQVAGGSFTGKPSSTGTGMPLAPSTSKVSRVEFYNNVGTLNSFNSSTASQPIGIKVYYSASNTPARADVIYGMPRSGDGIGADAVCPPNPYTSAWPNSHAARTDSHQMGVGGYLGLDANGLLGWVEPSAADWSSFGLIFSLTQRSAVGQTATLTYGCGTSVPAPASGDDYSSGVPSFTATSTRTLTLMAK